jgi:hypothetical protein
VDDHQASDDLDRYFLSPEVSDDELDQVLGGFFPEEACFRGEETGPDAELFAQLTGDPEWAAGFSRDLAQLDSGGRGVLQPEETRALLRSLAAANGHRGFSIGEFFGVLSWANQTRVSEQVLQLVLDGQLVVGFANGEAVFQAPPA